MSSLLTGLFLVVIFVLIILLWLAAYLLQKRLKAPEPETSTVLPGGEIDTKVKFKELVKIMTDADLKLAQDEAKIKKALA